MRSRRNLALAPLLLVALLLRAIVPVGLMPSAVADGSFLTLCPDSFGSAAITALLGEHAHHNHHQHHDPAASGVSAANPERCALGEGLASAATVDAPAIAILTPAPATFSHPAAPPAPATPVRLGYHARAPPPLHSA